MANLAGKTYEVQTSDGIRWTAADIHESRSPAIEQAEQLLDTNRYHAVQVIADSDRAGTETVFEKEAENKPEPKQINITPIEEAAYCKNLADFHGFEARRTIGRLMRQYLDEYGLTALELIFDAAHLSMFERDDKMIPAAVQRVAQLQAKQGQANPADRGDELYRAIEELKEQAGDTALADELAGTLAAGGLDAVVSAADMSIGKSLRPMLVRFVLARHLSKAADWDAKFLCLARLGSQDLSERAVGFLDEALAELMDAASAVMELLGGQPDLGTANRNIALLAVGRCPIPKNPLSCLEDVNNLMGRQALPLARRMLYERLAAEIAGTRPLTREGRDKDRDMFVTLVRDLIELAGLEGGPAVADAMTRRARIVLSPGEDDLIVEDAVARVLDLLPHRAVRMGYLLDLVVSPLGQAHQNAIFGLLGRLVQQLSSVASFLPKGSSAELRDQTMASLQQRLTAEGLPSAWREGIAQALDGFSKGVMPAETKPETKPYILDEETQRIIAMNPDHEIFNTGDILFQEGDAGEAAYIIRSGEVEILHNVGNEERVLAKLGRGEIFGEMALIDNQPRMATARVCGGAELAVITRDNIQARLGRLESSDMVLRRLIDVFLDRIRGEARSHE